MSKDKENKDQRTPEQETADQKAPDQKNSEEISETWAQDAVQDLLDFWEEQGVYIRE